MTRTGKLVKLKRKRKGDTIEAIEETHVCPVCGETYKLYRDVGIEKLLTKESEGKK